MHISEVCQSDDPLLHDLPQHLDQVSLSQKRGTIHSEMLQRGCWLWLGLDIPFSGAGPSSNRLLGLNERDACGWRYGADWERLGRRVWFEGGKEVLSGGLSAHGWTLHLSINVHGSGCYGHRSRHHWAVGGHGRSPTKRRLRPNGFAQSSVGIQMLSQNYKRSIIFFSNDYISLQGEISIEITDDYKSCHTHHSGSLRKKTLWRPG